MSLQYIYDNIKEMVKYRGYSIKPDETENPLDYTLNAKGYIVVEGEREQSFQRELTHILAVLATDKYTKSSAIADLHNIIAEYMKKAGISPLTAEIVFITKKEPTTNINKQLVKFRLITPNIDIYPYTYFKIVLPNHRIVPKHSIPSEEELEYLVKYYHVDLNNLPKMRYDDAQNIWLGLKPGHYVRIDRISETSGKAVAYRRIEI